MILVKLYGGIGNQMFQYAAGRSLALKNKCELKLDITHYDTLKLPNGLPYRSFDLSIFETQLNIATQKEIDLFKHSYSNIFDKGIKKLKNVFSSYSTIHEPYFHFYVDLLNMRGNIYIDGYWQCEKYFKEVENVIRNDFRIKTTIKTEGTIILEKIRNTNSICLNIRRQEFASNKLTINQFVGLDYLNNGIELMARKIDDPHFYVFSDELSWVKENLKIPFPHTIVESNLYGDRFRDCLYMMSSCNHFIIPNSTFGWWAAWLSSKPGKVVIAPEKWLSDNTKDTSDIYLNEWIRL